MNELTSLIRARSEEVDGPIALYAEREVKVRLGIPHRLFKENKGKPRHAYGSSVQPVSPTRAYQWSIYSANTLALSVSY
jgi:hypothetical protein